jgi:hypothetical protein
VTEPTTDQNLRRPWTRRLAEFLPGYFDEHPVLSPFRARASAILHGSTTMGIDDEFSDLDLWLLLPEAAMAELDAAAGTRFFEFQLDGKEGHLNAESVEGFRERIRGCDMDTIYQLRSAQAITDDAGAAAEPIRLARRPMREEVSRAFFFYHYVEMRGEHRACDNPIQRSDPVALLLSLPKVISHALRAAMVLDGQPYPYDKWLYCAAAGTPTGRLLAPSVREVLDLLAAGHLRTGPPESDHPVSLELRVIRRILVEAAQAKGIREPWLTRWWLHMDQARAAVENVRW